MQSQAHLKQLIGQLKTSQGRMDEDLADWEGDAEQFGSWSRNAMVPLKSKAKSRRQHDEASRKH